MKKSKSEQMGKKDNKFDMLKRFPAATTSIMKRTKTREELKSASDLDDKKKTAAKKPKITTSSLNFIQSGPQSAVIPGKFASSNVFYPSTAKKKEDQ